MANLNIQIDLTKIAGARVMEIEGKKSKRQCVVIPIDSQVGTVCDGYTGKGKDGMSEFKFFDDVKLNIVAIEYRTQRHGISHGLKASFNKEVYERMTEDQMYNSPWLGTVKPWGGNQSENTNSDDDLPEDDDSNDW